MSKAQLRHRLEECQLSMAARGQLDGYLPPHLWEQLRQRLQRIYRKATGEPMAVLAVDPPAPVSNLMGRWLPINQADKTITNVQDFPAVGLTLRNSDTYWVRDEDGRVYEAAWSEGKDGRDYWWDWEAESPVDPVEFMPHPLDPRWATLAAEGRAE